MIALLLLLTGSVSPKIVFEQLTLAGVARDAATLDKLYAPDYFHTNPDGSIMTRAQVLASYKTEPPIKVDAATHDDDQWHIDGDVAILSTRVTTSGRLGISPFTRRFRVTYVFVRRHHRWFAINSHATALP